MNRGTYLEIELGKITENARRVAEVCAQRGIEVLGVTKGFSAIPRIVEAIIAGGVDKLADARLENIMSLRYLGFTQEMTLLRIPMLSSVNQVAAWTNCSLNSELSVIRALSDAAQSLGNRHNIVLMVDVGDLREGVLPSAAADTLRKILTMKGVHVSGIGTNMGCYGGILPTEKNLSMLSELAIDLQNIAGRHFEVVSGGGTSSLTLIHSGEMPGQINQLRVGEGILLGTDTTHNCNIPWLYQDAFLLHAEIVEIKSKPSIPYGEIGLDAFGRTPEFEDRGVRKRAIVSLGGQDVSVDGIVPMDEGISILGASSDHMILDVSDAGEKLRVGDEVCFRLNYHGLLRLCSSKYIKRVYKYGFDASASEEDLSAKSAS